MVRGFPLATIKQFGGWIYMEQLHDHNKKTYENICRMYGEGIQRVAVVQPTGSGKSLLMAKLIEDNPNSRFFVLSTRHEINNQFKEKLDEKMLERSEFNIYCNMPNMKQEAMEILQPDYILLDEMHRALAKEWSKGIMRLLEMYPNAKVLGLSATPIRYLDKCRNVVEELFSGNLACDMSLSQAILDGILPMARYVCGVYSYEKDTESLNRKIEKSCNSEEEKKELLKELKVLKENLDKGHGVSDIFRKYIMTGSEKFVVFLKDTTHLGVMKPVIEKWFTDAGFTVRLYEVHSKNTEKDKEFQAFKEDTEDGIIKACLSVNMVAEGIHGDIGGVIMLRNTISANMYFQMIGRAFSCGKKTIPLIFDLVANSQFISDATDISFPNELRGEIEKRKEECEKEDKEYEVGFDVDEFIVMDEFMDVVSGFREIEGRLVGSFEKNVNDIIKYFNTHGRLPKMNSKDKLEQKLANFLIKERVSKKEYELKNMKYSDYRINKLESIPGFSWDPNKEKFNTFLYYLKCYKEIHPSNRIRNKEVFMNYPIGKQYSSYCSKYKCNLMDSDDTKAFESLVGEIRNQYELRMEENYLMAEECIKEGIIITKKNPYFKNVNLYEWVCGTLKNRYNNNQLTNDERKIVKQLIGFDIEELGKRWRKPIPIKVVCSNGQMEDTIYPNIVETAKSLSEKLNFAISSDVVRRCLKGNRKNELHGFKFEYANLIN